MSTLGVGLGIAGLEHGIFETLQGNVPTHGLFIQAIGAANRMWVFGTEDAFTFLPNFLAAGLLTILLSLVIVVWSVGFVHKKSGPSIFILMFVLLFLVGGGVGQIAFFLPVWACSTRINQPLTWWRKVLPERARPGLAKGWPAFLAAAVLLFLIALEIAIFGFTPGLNDPQHKQYICWSLLGLAFVFLLLSFASGFASDIQASRLEQR